MIDYSTIGINFNNKHTYKDLGMKMINSQEEEPPKKNKVTETIPFMNGSYDFSNLYSGSTYGDKQLTYTFLIENENIQGLKFKKILIDNWSMKTNEKSKLIDDDLPGYYYMAECIDVNYENYYTFGIVEFTFNAYPFKIAQYYEGNNLWDSFNFELDMLQETKFTVTGSKEVSIHNLSATNITPAVICSSDIEVIKNGVTYSLKTGTSKDYRLFLETGENKLTAKGNGTIEFRFRKELL